MAKRRFKLKKLGDKRFQLVRGDGAEVVAIIDGNRGSKNRPWAVKWTSENGLDFLAHFRSLDAAHKFFDNPFRASILTVAKDYRVYIPPFNMAA